MQRLLLLAAVGFAAQLVDGSLGMGFGVTSTTLLLIAGLSPALASASVHLAELGTNVASGVSHWRLGNVDWRLVGRLGVPGALGAFGGATFLSQISTAVAKPVMAAILGALGTYILLRYAFRPPAVAHARRSPHGSRFLVPLGLAGGFVDATGGGGWGPVATTTLLSAGKTAPRTVIGSVDTSEFLVSLAASLGYFINPLFSIRSERCSNLPPSPAQASHHVSPGRGSQSSPTICDAMSWISNSPSLNSAVWNKSSRPS